MLYISNTNERSKQHINTNSLPACPLDTRKVTSHRLQSEVVLYLISVTNPPLRSTTTYSCHLEVAEHTTCVSSHRASVANLRWACVVAHLLELELGFGADSGGERHVADDVTEGLPGIVVNQSFGIGQVDYARSNLEARRQGSSSPFRLGLLKGNALRVVAHDTRGNVGAHV